MMTTGIKHHNDEMTKETMKHNARDNKNAPNNFRKEE
jgi:hypothetical protein